MPRGAQAGGGELAEERLLRRARMHAALGEPVRLAMVQRLLVTDASPGELGATYGLATNVLAHHVKLLQAAGLVRRVRSEGDARRAYLQLRLDDPAVAALVAGHPGGAPDAGGQPVPAGAGAFGSGRPERVVFVCTANSARSQLAAATWRQLSGLPVASAGTHPAPRVHPRAVAAAHRHGLRIDPVATAQLVDVAARGDLVVCVCDNAHEELAAGDLLASGVVGRVHWAVPDPVPADTDHAFETAYTQLAGRVERLAHTLDPAARRPDPENSRPSKVRTSR
jgi:protein-tyrosine-phosphatase/DNA-binding transcriptional ArsR family regulator